MRQETFTCIGDTYSAPVVPATRKEWEEVRNKSWLPELQKRIFHEENDEKLKYFKSKLPVWTPRCAGFRNNHRKESEALQPLNRLMLDIDDKGHTLEILKTMTDENGQMYILEKGYKIKVFLVEDSIRMGTHIFVEIPEGLTPEDVQQLVGEHIGFDCDPAVKNVAGCIYQVPMSHTWYVDDEMFTVDDVQNGEKADTVQEVEAIPAAEETAAAEPAPAQELTYNGFSYRAIINKYWEIHNKGKEPHDGDRNSKTFELAKGLRSICNYDQKTLEAVIPRYDGFPEAEWRQTIANALKEPAKGISWRITQVLEALEKEQRMIQITGSAATHEGGLPRLPEDIPDFMKLVTSKTPGIWKDMVGEGIWSAVFSHFKGVTVQYTDGQMGEMRFSSVLIGRQSSGKSFVNEPIEHIMADITRKDAENRERENQWRKNNKGKGANKDKSPRPTDIVIQRMDCDTTQAASSQVFIDAETNGKVTIYSKVDEIELLNKVGNGRKEVVSTLTRCSFDSSSWGQLRASADSVNGVFVPRWTWSASCTPSAAVKYIDKSWVANGTLSRINVNAIVLPKGSHEKPVIGKYDEEFDANLAPYINRLNAANGWIRCEQADRLALELEKEYNAIADDREDEGFRQFIYRAIRIAWMKGIALYILDDYQWSIQIENYVRYSLKRDMYLKMMYFGNMINELENDDDRAMCQQPASLLGALPESFTMDDYQAVRRKLGKSGRGESTLRCWMSRNQVAYDDISHVYVKLKRA